MRGLTVKQPWAYAVLHLGKRVENRPLHPPPYLLGQRIAIHAGKSWARKALDWMRERGLVPEALDATLDKLTLTSSAIVGTALLVGWAEKGAGYEYDADDHKSEGLTREQAIAALDSAWYMGQVALVLDDVRPLAVPVPCRGQLGFWNLPAEVEAAVLRQEAA